MHYSLLIGMLSFFSFSIMDATNKFFLSNPNLPLISYFTYVKLTSLIIIFVLGLFISKRFLHVIDIKWTIIKTVLLAINALTTMMAVKYLPLATFAVFVSMIPILTSFLSYLFLKDKFTKYHLLCLILCLIGVTIIFSPSLQNDDYLIGLFLASVTIITASSSAIIIRKYLPYENATGSSFYSLLLATLLGFFLSLFDSSDNYSNNIIIPDMYAVICIFISAFATVIGKVLYMKAFQIANPVKVAYLQYTHILWSFLFGFLIFNEPFTKMILIGYVLIIASAFAITKLNIYYSK